MSIDHRLLDLLVCPVCKGALQPQRDAAHRLVELQCLSDRLGFPVRDGIALMLEPQSRSLDGLDEAAAAPA